MITPQEIKEALSELPGIGTYFFKSINQSTPAIAIDDGTSSKEATGEDLSDEQPQITGLELVIAPQLAVPISLAIGGYVQVFSHEILLKQWDISLTTLDYLDDAIEILSGLGLQVGAITRIPRLSKLDNIETLRIQASEQELI